MGLFDGVFTRGKKEGCVTVLIPAAGSGARMGGAYKPLEMLCGREVLAYSLETFQNCPMVKKVVIAARSDKTDDVKKLCKEYGFDKVTAVVEGGTDRQSSVENAFKAAFRVPEDITRLVAVHDAARPLLTSEEAGRVFETAYKYGGAVCASRVRDTVKRADSADVVCEGVDREGLWLMQTPQVFDTDIYHTALALAKQNGVSATDDCTLVADAGFKVVISQTGATNLKITYPEDMLLAEAIIKSRNGEIK